LHFSRALLRRKQMQVTVIRIIVIALAALGFLGVGGISHDHWHHVAPCPMIGPIPACYIILVGYGLIFLSMFVKRTSSLRVFVVGWTAVIILALLGVLGELTATLSCPSSEIGIPKCYFSAALSIVIGLLYWRWYYLQRIIPITLNR